ncbi:VirB3 family type IV secretion system protein [uncultured Brevundimonas sp.]|uniref:type IV secretion system protein VirB3 n=1 Tax=uncultured Brevundimonas sp. TaxID=213418 RepID=UPI002615C851|nr:VirB3 family type IV secretion system protein [uncultured Brevundimonas sp.]
MAERSPLFLGLIRPPRLLGLPILYAMVWFLGAVLSLVWLQSLWVFAAAAVAYPVLWLAAEWDENFIGVVAVVSSKTRPTKNRSIWNGDSYAP